MDETETLPEIASFRPGVWNGKNFTREYLQDLDDCFNRYCTGPDKEFAPWLNINHKDEFRYGEITGSRLDPDGTWHLGPVVKVPKDIAAAIKAGMLTQPSVEILEPKSEVVDGKETGKMLGYYNREGVLERRPVLKCLALLGNQMPGVKGLPNVPDPIKFNDCGGRLLTFSNGDTGNMMNRQQMIEALKALGIDTSAFTDAIPDEAIQAILDFAQKTQTAPQQPAAVQQADANAGGDQNADGTSTVQMADPSAAADQTGLANVIAADAMIQPGQTGGLSPATSMLPQIPTPTTMTMKFSDRATQTVFDAVAPAISAHVGNAINQAMGNANRILVSVQAKAAAIDRHNSAQMKSIKAQRIKRFFDEMSTSGQILPAMQPWYLIALNKCDHTSARKFSSGIAGNGTELEELMTGFASSLPKLKTAGSKVIQSQPTLNDGITARPDVINRTLAGSHTGKAILALEAKTKK